MHVQVLARISGKTASQPDFKLRSKNVCYTAIARLLLSQIARAGATMKSQNIIPVFISILVIILVAVLEKQSKLFAALVATMPLSAPLALWIVYSSNSGDKAAVSQFTQSLLLGLLPSLGFLITVWLGARAGMKLAQMLVTGYSVWAVGAILLFLLRNTLGIK